MLIDLALAAVLPLGLAFDAAEHSNAVYHVACLAGDITCSRDLYEGLWHGTLQWSDRDQRQLDRWKQVVSRARAAAPPADSAPLLANFPSYYPSLRAQTAIVAAVAGAGSPGRVASATRAVVSVDDGVALQDVVQHFARRLRPWWLSTGRAVVASHIEQVRKTMTADHQALSAAVATFLGAELPGGRVFVHAVPSPAPAGDAATATVVREHFFVEVVTRDTATATLWKAMHELTHAYYDAAPAEVHATLMRQFVDAAEPGSPAFYTYFNEALATAVQLLVLERDGQSGGADQDTYRHPYIPRLARALLPIVRTALASGGSITQGIVDAYLKAGRTELGSVASSPAFTLAAAALIGADPHGPSKGAFGQAFHVWASTSSVEQWRRCQELSAVVFVTYAELAELRAAGQVPLPDLAGPQERFRAFAYTRPHNTRSRVVVLAARDVEAVAQLVGRLATLRRWMPTEGVFLTID